MQKENTEIIIYLAPAVREQDRKKREGDKQWNSRRGTERLVVSISKVI